MTSARDVIGSGDRVGMWVTRTALAERLNELIPTSTTSRLSAPPHTHTHHMAMQNFLSHVLFQDDDAKQTNVFTCSQRRPKMSGARATGASGGVMTDVVKKMKFFGGLFESKQVRVGAVVGWVVGGSHQMLKTTVDWRR
jgi:hypothetical protein